MRNESSKLAQAKRSPRQQVRIGRTRVGKGVFASKCFAHGSLISEINGEMISDPDYVSSYAMDPEDGRQFEPAAPFRFVNHCCDPNCEFDFFDVSNRVDVAKSRRFFLFAKRQIAVGEELTIDYRWPPSYAIRCRCGSPQCRGWIVRESRLHEIPAHEANQ